MADKVKEKILEVKDLDVSYQKLRILFQVSLDVDDGEVAVVVGRTEPAKRLCFALQPGF